MVFAVRLDMVPSGCVLWVWLVCDLVWYCATGGFLSEFRLLRVWCGVTSVVGCGLDLRLAWVGFGGWLVWFGCLLCLGILGCLWVLLCLGDLV